MKFLGYFIGFFVANFHIASSSENCEQKQKVQIVKASSIDQLNWLTGNWEGALGEGVLEESWLPPKGNTIAAVVRLTNEKGTQFVELIKIEKIDESFELRLNLFDSELKPLAEKPQVLKLIKIGDKSVVFEGASEGAHRRLSYQLNPDDVFEIRIITAEGKKIRVDLKRL